MLGGSSAKIDFCIRKTTLQYPMGNDSVLSVPLVSFYLLEPSSSSSTSPSSPLFFPSGPSFPPLCKELLRAGMVAVEQAPQKRISRGLSSPWYWIRLECTSATRMVGGTSLMASYYFVSCFQGMTTPNGSSSHDGRGQPGRRETFGKDVDRSGFLSLLLRGTLSMVMEGCDQ